MKRGLNSRVRENCLEHVIKSKLAVVSSLFMYRSIKEKKSKLSCYITLGYISLVGSKLKLPC